MRRLVAHLLIFVLLLAGCTPKPTSAEPYYYLLVEPVMGVEGSLFQAELRPADTTRSWQERIQLYLDGTDDPALKSPFPRGLQVSEVTVRESENQVDLTLSEEYNALSGAALTLANACLVQTLTAWTGMERVVLHSTTGKDLMASAAFLSADQYLSEIVETEREYTVRLYFADQQNRYLLPTTRRVVAREDASLGVYILHQLIEGPTEEGQYAVIPEGTRLLHFEVVDGVAMVDFSAEFFEKRPRTELGERMTIYALVNSLTGLESIDSVCILVEGSKIEYYQYMMLSEPLQRCESAIGPVRSGINEFDATLYYRSWSDEFLASAPTRILRDDTKNMGEQIVLALLNNEPPSGMFNLMPEGTELLSAEIIEGVCHVDLSKAFANITGGYRVEMITVTALVASLCSIDGISSVLLTIEGGTMQLPNFDLSHPIAPHGNWFFPS